MTPENAVETLRRQVRATQRVAALRQRRAEQGLVRLELYVHPDDHAAVKAVAQALTQQRSCKPACTPAPRKPIGSCTIRHPARLPGGARHGKECVRGRGRGSLLG
jgi:hypothetical protein